MTPFHDLHDYMALPRLTGLRLAPDGSWLAASVSALSWAPSTVPVFVKSLYPGVNPGCLGGV